MANGDFEHLTTGLNPSGLYSLLHDDIKPNILDKAISKLEGCSELTDLENILKDNWKGQARIDFINKLTEVRKLIRDDIKAEESAFDRRFGELEQNYYDQDKFMGQNIL